VPAAGTPSTPRRLRSAVRALRTAAANCARRACVQPRRGSHDPVRRDEGRDVCRKTEVPIDNR
jgi:hypothetical protein